MEMEQGPPEQAPQGGGEQALKEGLAGIMQQAQSIQQFVASMAEAGMPPEVLQDFQQASELMQSGIQKISGGGQPQQGGQAVNADTAGTNAQPVTQAG